VERLRVDGLPRLFIPSPDSFIEVDAVPMLPTGKVDLRALKALAREAFDEQGHRIPARD
jgi:acyl-[acyl-carrier-protein]-phospholipid O-acyltransferase/long-chain-fatty-acid--[acyl-carrier-protein] ligase